MAFAGSATDGDSGRVPRAGSHAEREVRDGGIGYLGISEVGTGSGSLGGSSIDGCGGRAGRKWGVIGRGMPMGGGRSGRIGWEER